MYLTTVKNNLVGNTSGGCFFTSFERLSYILRSFFKKRNFTLFFEKRNLEPKRQNFLHEWFYSSNDSETAVEIITTFNKCNNSHNQKSFYFT